MKRRMLPIFAVVLLGVAGAVIAQTQDKPQQAQPAVEQPASQAPANQTPSTQPADTTAAAQTSTESREMPKTASPLPLLALVGVASAASALAMRRAS